VAESSALAVDASELDLSAADNTSVATSGRDDVWIAGSVDSSCRLQVPAPAGAVAERGRASDVEDSTEDDQGTSQRLCAVSTTTSVTRVSSCTSAFRHLRADEAHSLD